MRKETLTSALSIFIVAIIALGLSYGMSFANIEGEGDTSGGVTPTESRSGESAYSASSTNTLGVCSRIGRPNLGAKSSCSDADTFGATSLDETVFAIAKRSILNQFVFLHGASLDDIGTCAAYKVRKDPEINCNSAPYSMYSCDELDNSVEVIDKKGGYDLYCNANKSNGRAAGSIINVTQRAMNSSAEDPIPVNLAFYFKSNLQKIPVVQNTTFAQVSTADYTDTFSVQMAMNLWEATRDIAYALMSIVMLVIGIMIIMRKSISPQVVVNVQNAIPRVFISLFLITFSYPIGAMMVAGVDTLKGMITVIAVGRIIHDLDQTIVLFDGNMWGLITLIVAGAIPAFGGLLAALLLSIVSVVVLIVMLIKQMFITIKMIMMIIFAPLQFAWAAIPGQEESIGAWFKQMAAHMLAIPAMFFFMVLGWYIFIQPYTDPAFLSNLMTGGVGDGSGFRPIMALITSPMIAVMIMLMGLGADKKIDKLFGFDKRR